MKRTTKIAKAGHEIRYNPLFKIISDIKKNLDYKKNPYFTPVPKYCPGDTNGDNNSTRRRTKPGLVITLG